MKTLFRIIAIFALVGLTLSATATQLSDTPTEVQKTIKLEVGTNKVSSITETKDKGRQAFSVQFTQNNQRQALLISPEGLILRDTRIIKESAGARNRIALTDLPKPVQDTILTQSESDKLPIKGIKIKRTKDKETKQEVYKVEFQQKGANTKLWIRSDGMLLKQEQ